MARSTSRPKGARDRTQEARLSGTNLERAGDYNQRVTLQAIRLEGPLTRADLAAMTGLTAPTIANITKRLLDENLILEAGKLHGERGQPAMKLAVNPDGCFSLGMNIDRDHITLVLLDFAGQVRARATREIDFASPDTVLAFFEAETRRMLEGWELDTKPILGIGVAMPDDMGSVDLPHRPPEYSAWNHVDVRAMLSPVLSVPVYVENDAAAAALGELQYGHGLQKPSFFYILLASGLGGGLVIEGEYFRGANGRSGEIGFLPVRSRRTEGRTLQDAVSLSALYADLEASGFKPAAPEALLDLPPEGQAIIDSWIDRAAELLAPTLAVVNCVVNPEAVYLGGRLPAAIVARLTHALNQRLTKMESVPIMAKVLRAATAEDAPAIGAATLPFIGQLLPSKATLRKTAKE
ncbi:ROK family transcriptional regulator [Caulobacter segnis]|uniref:ROK family transcriptional regulator n=1 Tax=Caulobacter segnis TaxID=88688 RepID=UPI0028626E4A|nr:ROK family transcriptional regulator [Caulobacter segnis]MDR6625898.1 putative NBD/HSP70 family sugar kinase [Caulobacter segnis]